MRIFSRSIICSLVLHIIVISLFIIVSYFFTEKPLKQTVVVELVQSVPSVKSNHKVKPVSAPSVIETKVEEIPPEGISSQEITELLQEKKVLEDVLIQAESKKNNINPSTNKDVNPKPVVNNIPKESSKDIAKAPIIENNKIKEKKPKEENVKEEVKKEDNKQQSLEVDKVTPEILKDKNESKDEKVLFPEKESKEINTLSSPDKMEDTVEPKQKESPKVVENKAEIVKKPFVLKKDDNFDMLLDNALSNDKVENKMVEDINNILSLTSQEKLIVINKITECWAALASIREKDLILNLSITMNKNKSVADVRIISYEGEADNIIEKQELLNIEEQIKIIFSKQQCMILPLPEGKYESWKVFAIKLNLKGFFQ